MICFEMIKLYCFVIGTDITKHPVHRVRNDDMHARGMIGLACV